jgi:hypothetical protein
VGELEPILGDIIKEINKESCTCRLTPEEYAKKVEQTALAIEMKKQELEHFDKERTKLIGQDNYFDYEVNDILKRERFITPAEVYNLFLGFIYEACPKTKIEPIKGVKHAYTLTPDKQLSVHLLEGITKKQENNWRIHSLNNRHTKHRCSKS